MVATCALYGGTTYANSWLGINVLVILITFLAIAIVYSLSSVVSDRMRGRMRAAARSELTQAFISAVILAMLLGVVVTACNISVAATKSLVPAAYNGMDPFQYANYYLGNLSLNTGLNLLTSLYSKSVQYAVEAQILQSIGALLNTGISSIFSILKSSFNVLGIFSVGIAAGVHLSVLFTTLSGLYLSISSLVTLAIGLLFIQFLLLPVLQYSAFAIILPVALGMRSLAFMGNALKRAANSVLALAIVLYIVYPLTIAFNGYAISWIFSTQNPSYQYLHSTYVVPNIPVTPFFSSSNQLANPNPGGFAVWGNFNDKDASLIGPIFKNFIILPSTVFSQLQLTINQVAQFLFAAVFMMVLDLAILMGFATGLSKALNGGVEGAESFWSGI